MPISPAQINGPKPHTGFDRFGVTHEGKTPISKRFVMRHQFTLEYWRDGDCFVGRLIEVPGVFSQGKSLDELNENIQDAYELMVTQDRPAAPSTAQRRQVELEV